MEGGKFQGGPYFVDAVFRGGSKHSNYGDTVVKTLEHVVERIRDEYDEEVPIVLTADIGFFDQVSFRAFEELGIGYVVGGKLYSDIKKKAEAATEADWNRLHVPEIWERVNSPPVIGLSAI